MAASNQAKLIVWTKAAGLCSFPECRRELVQEPSRDGSVPVGEIAHIVAEQPDGPRGQSPLSLEQRNHPPNLMLLCPTHHTEIDKAPQTYTVERLIEFKRRHEMWVRLQLAKPNLAGKRAMPAPEMLTETVHSTVLPVLQVPRHVYLAPPKTFDHEEIRKEAIRRAPYIIHNKQLVTFEDLIGKDNAFSTITNRLQAKREDASDWWRDPDKHRLYVYLLGRCLNKITGARGLMLDRKRDRYYFLADKPNTERKEKYRPLNMGVSELSVVWQPIQKSRGEPYGHWLHRAISFRFMLVSHHQWLIALRPEFHVTTNGRDDYEASEVGSKVTRKKSRMYNYNILSELNFWRDFLSDGRPRIVLSLGEQRLVIGTTLLQTEITWPGVPGDTRPFRNVAIPDNLFSSHELAELEEDENDEEEWQEEEDFDGFL
jgi:hypothetical protein